ncbi:hypothetical protein GQ607_015637 [Colletotrichum asianum]|uniref:Ubiquitin-like protease family profile domain-containing protein n=1 Tax=Colletotrichum asianum TaxID=702518 RepID=A0A8H3W065_9PEZI|nr:hypothetical protein GQ607_015637 [Colletotrichum asianum]
MRTRSQTSPATTLDIQAEARLLQDNVDSSILNVTDFTDEVARLAEKYKTTHTLAQIIALFPGKTQQILSRLLKITPNNIPSLFHESSSVRFYIELKQRAACYPLDKVIDALIEARNNRKAGLAGAGISKTKIWAPSDVKGAEEILQRDQKSAAVDTKLLVCDLPDIKSSEGNSGPVSEKETLIENVGHTAVKLESEQQIEEGDQQIEEGDQQIEEGDQQVEEGDQQVEEDDQQVEEGDQQVEEDDQQVEEGDQQVEEGDQQVEEGDQQVEEGDQQVEEDDHVTSSVTPHNCTKLDDEHDGYMETAVPPVENSRRYLKRRETHFLEEDPIHQCLRPISSKDREPATPKFRRSSLNLPQFSPSPLHVEYSTTPRACSSPILISQNSPSPSPSPRQETAITEMSCSSEVSESQVEVSQMAPDTRSFASLAPGTELTGATMVTCLQVLLGAVASSKWSMIPSDFDVAGVGVYEEDLEGAEKVLVPLHIENPNHWVLLTIRPDPPEVEVFDSLSDVSSWKKKIEGSVGDLCRGHLGKFLGSRMPTVVHRQSLQQVGDKDCGIYTLVNAAYLIAGRRAPVTTDPNVWRKALASFDYGSALDAEDAPWRLRPELDLAGYDEKEDMFYARKGQRVTDDDWSASKASRKAYEDHVDRILMESRTRNLQELQNHHKDILEVFAVVHDILSTTSPAQRERESKNLSQEYAARAAILSSLEDIPNPTIEDKLYREKVKARRRACLKRLKSVQMSGRALKAAERRLQLELEDVVERQQKVKERGVEAET